MDVELLKTFLELHRTRHFGKAAENLYITQSAVSARIRQLEDDLGVRLFIRDRNNLRLTAAGQKLLRHAESIMAAWNQARLDIAVDDKAESLIAFGGLPSLWDIYLTDWLVSLRRHFPHVALSGEVLAHDNMVRRLLDHSLDLVFTYEFPQLPEVETAEVLSIRLIMVSSKPGVTAATALRDGYVYVDWGEFFANTHARQFPDSPAPVIRLKFGSAARNFVNHCGGAAYLPELLVNGDLERGRLHRVADAPAISRRAYASYRRDNERRALLEQLLRKRTEDP